MLLHKLLLNSLMVGVVLLGFATPRPAAAVTIIPNPGMTPGHINARFTLNPTLSEVPDGDFSSHPEWSWPASGPRSRSA